MSGALFAIEAGELPPGDMVKCGNRTDLPKKERVHAYVSLGRDERGFIEGEVLACGRCGTDKFKRDKGDGDG